MKIYSNAGSNSLNFMYGDDNSSKILGKSELPILTKSDNASEQVTVKLGSSNQVYHVDKNKLKEFLKREISHYRTTNSEAITKFINLIDKAPPNMSIDIGLLLENVLSPPSELMKLFSHSLQYDNIKRLLFTKREDSTSQETQAPQGDRGEKRPASYRYLPSNYLYEREEDYDKIVDLYVKRFLEKHKEMSSPKFLPTLRTIALLIAIKQSSDSPVSNKKLFENNPQFLQLINKMESAFLKEIEWNISTSELSSEQDELAPPTKRPKITPDEL